MVPFISILGARPTFVSGGKSLGRDTMIRHEVFGGID